MTKMDLWNRVCRTNPDATKRVNQRGGFTAIDAHSQIEAATKEFGPIGEGWGVDYDLSYPPNDTVVAMVTVWHGSRDNHFSHAGQASLYMGQNKPDNDCVKKAVTDGITKCLSLLGFNADVFLGKFDDNKYVQQRKKEEAQPKDKEGGKKNPDWTGNQTKGQLQEFYRAVAADIMSPDIEDVNQLTECLHGYKGELMDNLKANLPSYYDNNDADQPGLLQLYKKRMKQLENK